jgi:hypothetical protein
VIEAVTTALSDRYPVSRTPDKYTLARKPLANEAEALVRDDWGGSGTNTDIVPRPARVRPVAAPPLPDPDDPTLRMSPERVLALLKAENTIPEPLDPTPGRSTTRVFDPAEVSNAQKESLEVASPARANSALETKSSPRATSPQHKQPFEVVESQPARPPRAPKLPSEFSTVPAGRTPLGRLANMRQVKRLFGLLALAIAVFMTTFLVTKGLRDERARIRAWDFINGIGATIGGWFSSRAESPAPKATPNVLSLQGDSKSPAPAKPAAAEPERAATSAEPSTPVIRLEDLKTCSSPSCETAPTQAKSGSAKRRPSRSRTP